MHDNKIKKLTKFIWNKIFGGLNKYQIMTYIIFLGVPIFSILTCSGWNEGSMRVSHCLINCIEMEEIANFMYGSLLISVFLAGIPIFLYIWLVMFIANIFASETKPEISNDQTEIIKK